MRLRSILEEAWLNLRGGTSRGAIFAIALAVILATFAGAEVITVAALENQADRFRNAGGSTLIYTAQGQISGSACDALAAIPTVRGAGAIRRATVDETATALPGTTVPTFDVSPTFGGFTALGRPPAGQGAIISDELSAALQVKAGGILHLVSGSTRVAGVYDYPQDGRAPGLGYAILIPTGVSKPFDACWVESWPQTSAIEGLLTSVVISRTGSHTEAPPVLAQLNGSLGRSFDGSGLFNSRLTRWAAYAAAAAGFLLGLLSVRLRRLELASARHAGVRSTAQITQIAIETLMWAGCSVAIALAGVILLARATQATQPGTLVDLGGRVLEAGGASVVIGAIVGAALASERLLFRYFKDR